MANTYSALFFHLVFSTKNRKCWIRPEIENRIWTYTGGIARSRGLVPIQIGGYDDHAHALVMAKPVHSPSEIAKWLKADSSKWIHSEFENMRSFQWQDGYGAFTVSKSNVPAVVEYIKTQRQHHEKESFDAEYERLMKLHDVEYDLEYLFG
jgi:REP element-mobilizing transposase RayT